MTAAMDGPRDGSRFGAALAALRREITIGRYKDTEMLPGERDLSDLLGISRTTLRRVLASLVDDGLLSHRHGVGTFLRRADHAAVATAARLTGFSDDMRAQGHVPSCREVEGSRGLPSPEEAMILACAPAQDIIRLSRLRCADGLPIAIEQTIVPRHFIDIPDALAGSLFETLDRRGFRPVRALQRVQAGTIGDGEADRLHAPRGSGVVRVRRTIYLPDGRCCAFSRITFRADGYDVITELGAYTEASARKT